MYGYIDPTTESIAGFDVRPFSGIIPSMTLVMLWSSTTVYPTH